MSFSLYRIQIEAGLSRERETLSQIRDVKKIEGGSINECYSFQFADVSYFIKENESKRYPGMFATEANGLKELEKCGHLVVPRPILKLEFGDQQFLILEFLKEERSNEEFFEKLGKAIASLHRIKGPSFGFTEDNYIGSVSQKNDLKANWTEFFITQRIEPLIKWCFDEKMLDKILLRSFKHLFDELHSLFPEEKPSLLHGDLWSGNIMNTTVGPAVFDPAVYYGHREMDIAMTKLFGGFQKSFYEAYEAEFPLEKGFHKRIDICNLYPLLVHVKLFGGSYLSRVLSIIKQF